MPWGRVGDDALSYPRLLAVAGIPGAPSYAVNEVFGFFMACACQSAGHVTDYVVNTGAVQNAGRARWKKLLEWSVTVGLLTPIETDDGLPAWLMHNDPKFIHIRTSEELEAEDRKRDANKKPHLVREVRHRDGDQCRYCGIFVVWDGRKSARSGELDHRNPTEYATQADHLVVACRSCNGARQDNSNGWDLDHPLQPAPTHPYYGESTAAYLTKNGIPTEANVEPGATKARSSATQQQPTRAARDAAARAPQPPTKAPDWATGTTSEVATELPPNSDTRSIGTTSDGSGRDGSGPGPAQGPGPGTNRRRRRGRRGGSRTPETTSPRTTSTTQDTQPPHTQPHDQEPDVSPPCCAHPFPATDAGMTLCLTCGTES